VELETGCFEQRGLSAWIQIPSSPLRTGVSQCAAGQGFRREPANSPASRLTLLPGLFSVDQHRDCHAPDGAPNLIRDRWEHQQP